MSLIRLAVHQLARRLLLSAHFSEAVQMTHGPSGLIADGTQGLAVPRTSQQGVWRVRPRVRTDPTAQPDSNLQASVIALKLAALLREKLPALFFGELGPGH
jgi:hypothetical protein